MAAIDVQITAIPTVEITHPNVFVGEVVTEQINGVTIGTSVSGSTNNEVIENTLGTPVGTAANPSVVPDATVQLNGTTVGTIPSGDSDSFTVNLDGSPSGVWDGTAWQVTSTPCADATVELNGVEMATIPSGDTKNISIRQSLGATDVGSKQGSHWRIDDSAISINGSPVADVKAEDSLDIDVTQDGSPVGSWNGSAWIVPSCLDGTVENSDTSYSATVASGGTLVVPNTPISANGDLVINQPSTIAKDVVVRYETQGTVLTTIVGGDVVVPDSAAAATLTIGVYSDAGHTTPITQGQFSTTTYLIAENVTGITPIEYLFAYEDLNDDLVAIYVGANDNTSWVIDAEIGNGRMFCFATEDGSNWVGGSIAFEVLDPPFDLTRAIRADKTNDYAQLPTNALFDFNSSFLLAYWIRVESISGQQYLIDRSTSGATGNGYSTRITSTGKVRFWEYLASNLVDSVSTLSLNTWYHVVVGHNSATGRNEIYINGVLDNFLGGIVLTQSVGGSLRLQNSLLLPGPAGGYMKEVVFANVAPTTAIASGLYNGGAGQLASAVILSANIKAYYRMRDAVGSVSMIDSSVNGLTGLIFNYAAPTYGYVTSP